MQKHEKKDEYVIGLGASSGAMAAELAKAGVSVVGLEAGPYFSTREMDNAHGRRP